MEITALPSRSFMRRLALLKLILVSVLLSIIYLLFTVNPTHAYNSSTETDVGNPTSSAASADSVLNTNSDVPKNLHSFAQIVLLESMSAMACQLSGYDPLSPNHKCLGVDPQTGKIGFVEDGGGMIGVMGMLIDATFVPPASSTQYIAYLKNNFGITKSAYAQLPSSNPCSSNVRGVGFC